jgi:hypothetical protein
MVVEEEDLGSCQYLRTMGASRNDSKLKNFRYSIHDLKKLSMVSNPFFFGEKYTPGCMDEMRLRWLRNVSRAGKVSHVASRTRRFLDSLYALLELLHLY